MHPCELLLQTLIALAQFALEVVVVIGWSRVYSRAFMLPITFRSLLELAKHVSACYFSQRFIGHAFELARNEPRKFFVLLSNVLVVFGMLHEIYYTVLAAQIAISQQTCLNPGYEAIAQSAVNLICPVEDGPLYAALEVPSIKEIYGLF